MNLKKNLRPLVYIWLIFGFWFFYSYFAGENSLITYMHLKRDLERLKAEKQYWQKQVELMREHISAFEKGKGFYYSKLSREMFVRAKRGERVYIFTESSNQE